MSDVDGSEGSCVVAETLPLSTHQPATSAPVRDEDLDSISLTIVTCCTTRERRAPDWTDKPGKLIKTAPGAADRACPEGRERGC